MDENTNILNSAEIMKNVLTELRYGARPFSVELGVTPMSIYHIISGKNRISSDLADKIIKKFPNVNYLYLTKGILPVLLQNPKLINNQDNLLNGISLPKNKDYNLESFIVLKNIEEGIELNNELLKELIDVLKQKKADNL